MLKCHSNHDIKFGWLYINHESNITYDYYNLRITGSSLDSVHVSNPAFEDFYLLAQLPVKSLSLVYYNSSYTNVVPDVISFSSFCFSLLASISLQKLSCLFWRPSCTTLTAFELISVGIEALKRSI